MTKSTSSRVAHKWSVGEPGLIGWCSIGSSYSCEIMASAGFDAIGVDLQHGMFGFDVAVTMLQSVHGHNVDAWARVATLEPADIMRLLDAGATTIICPMIESGEQAAELVSICRYPPAGRRSFGPSRNLLVSGPSYVKDANDRIGVWAMVETSRGVENIQDIVAVDGLDGVYVGPSDLAMSLGVPVGMFPLPPDLDEAVTAVFRATKSAGLRAGIFCLSAAMASDMKARGFDVITLGNDASLLKAGIAAFLAPLETVTPEFLDQETTYGS